jgi:3-hydroxyisobutyrate dehydrogenase-like beta-hydroxyacid dehydrogenase
MADEHHGIDGRVAVLGTGIMGSAMARNLVAAGLPTTVWDRSRQATERLVALGAVAAPSPAEAVREARVVITMLPTADVVESVVFDGHAADGDPLPLLSALSPAVARGGSGRSRAAGRQRRPPDAGPMK